MSAINNHTWTGKPGLTLDEALAAAQKNGERVVPTFFSRPGRENGIWTGFLEREYGGGHERPASAFWHDSPGT